MENHSIIQSLKEETKQAIGRRDTGAVEKNLKTLKELYANAADTQEKEAIGNQIAITLYHLAELYVDSMNPFDTLLCLNGCRDLTDDFPQSTRYAYYLLQVMTGLLYIKVQMNEDGMVEEYTDEIIETADRFPDDEDITMQACACLANLIPLCGSFDAPISLAYRIADKMEPIAQRFGSSPQILEAYCHVLVSVSTFADRTGNTGVYNKYMGALNEMRQDKKDVLGPGLRQVEEHMRQCGLY